jgi:hypothetical protein
MEIFEPIPPIAVRSRNHCSKITNGVDLLAGIDGRSADARRYRDLVESYKAELSHEWRHKLDAIAHGFKGAAGG